MTGEHWDQLFDSDKMFCVPWSELNATWEGVLGEELRRWLASVSRADAVLEFLGSVV